MKANSIMDENLRVNYEQLKTDYQTAIKKLNSYSKIGGGQGSIANGDSSPASSVTLKI